MVSNCYCIVVFNLSIVFCLVSTVFYNSSNKNVPQIEFSDKHFSLPFSRELLKTVIY